MKMLGSARWVKRIKSIAVASAIALSVPMTAIAQTSTTDQNFLNDLYSFLQSQDALSHAMATYIEADQNSAPNAVLAQSICNHMSDGGQVQELYDYFVTIVMHGANGADQATYQEIEYSAELYFGSVMNLGSAYYCPEYQAEVIQILNTL